MNGKGHIYLKMQNNIYNKVFNNIPLGVFLPN